jgi:3-dehydrosphinganine reductase
MKKNNETLSSQIVQIESVDISNSFIETEKAINRLIQNAGPADILINNAGISYCGEFSETNSGHFENLMKVNYLGSVYCTKAVVDSMKKRRFGRIVFVSSQAGQIGIFGYTGYSATKFLNFFIKI